jgi:uncharacterized protein YwqG
MPKSGPTLEETLSSAGLGRIASPLAALAAPCIRIEPVHTSGGGESRIGGLPRLPAGTAWPSWNGAPLAHLCQLDLTQLAPLAAARELPPRGLLSFFYVPDQSTWGFDPRDRGSWQVLYHPEDAVRELEPPAELPAEGRYRQTSVRFEESLSLPSVGSAAVQQLGPSDGEYDALCDLAESAGSPAHQLLGHPLPVQGEMELECQLVSHGIYCGDESGYRSAEAARLAPGAADWRLLLQLDSDEDRDFMWGDLGRLYFWIRRADIEARAFERAWMILQCS